MQPTVEEYHDFVTITCSSTSHFSADVTYLAAVDLRRSPKLTDPLAFSADLCVYELAKYLAWVMDMAKHEFYFPNNSLVYCLFLINAELFVVCWRRCEMCWRDNLSKSERRLMLFPSHRPPVVDSSVCGNTPSPAQMLQREREKSIFCETTDFTFRSGRSVRSSDIL
ncbi:hypothetical protein CEXT_232491 [Caerostris extrusa]|uniref:Uncharacterized protein n=1 Tax=Caerostris extrusa TaxID=172846 RepID=A0AAV4X5Z5_CAEEX|nr:hypothetical protein CEXT_232491 [Caerostris extrusa]